VVTEANTEDYTLYTGSMVNNSRTYYFSSYENHQIGKLTLDDQLLTHTDPIVFNYQNKQEGFDNLNIKL
jgi:choloylglycine hydrolase